MSILIIFTIIGLLLKVWAAHRLRKFLKTPGAISCMIFIGITYAQTILELYGYYNLVYPSGSEHLLIKLYYVSIVAIALFLPTIVDLTVLRQFSIVRQVLLITLWALISINILLTDWIIEGVKALPQAFTRVPGPYYGLIPVASLSAVLYCVLRLAKIMRSSQDELIRTKACNIAIGIALLVLTSFAVTLLMRFGVPITMAGVLPLSIGILSIVLAEQFNAIRIFDLRVIIPFSRKWRQLWNKTRHIHTVSVDPTYCRGLIDEYTDSLIDAADKVCNNQRDIAAYIGVSQATISRRVRKLDKQDNNH